MKKELVCINCPIGCHLSVDIENGMASNTTGNLCYRGCDYAKQEAIRPMRILTCLIPVKGLDKPLSLRTDGLIPKDMIFSCVAELKNYHPSPPIRCGDMIIQNICNTGCNMIATMDILANY